MTAIIQFWFVCSMMCRESRSSSLKHWVWLSELEHCSETTPKISLERHQQWLSCWQPRKWQPNYPTFFRSKLKGDLCLVNVTTAGVWRLSLSFLIGCSMVFQIANRINLLILPNMDLSVISCIWSSFFIEGHCILHCAHSHTFFFFFLSALWFSHQGHKAHHIKGGLWDDFLFNSAQIRVHSSVSGLSVWL